MPVPDDDERPKKKAAHTVGEDVSMLSLGELGERIALLKQEIARLEATVTEKSVSRNAAQSVFRK